MYIEERHQAILDIISEQGSVSTTEIRERFGVSYDSAKRDLRILEEKGLLRRTHGGAIPVTEPTPGRNNSIGMAAPTIRGVDSRFASLADEAVRLIADLPSVYLPGGEIGKAIADGLVRRMMKERQLAPFRSVPEEKRIRVTTNSPETASVLMRSSDIRVVMLGGELVSGSVTDSIAVSMLSKLRFNLAFVAAPHYSDDFGISCDGGAELGFLTALTDASRRVAAICTSDAKDTEGAVSVCPPSKVFAVIDIEI